MLTIFKKSLPQYLITTIGTVWVTCKKCGTQIPIWQAADEGEERTGKKFTCPTCRGCSDAPLPIPTFVNVK